MARQASLSRDLQSGASVPLLVHSLYETRSSVLSLATNDTYIFSGSQNRDISVRLQDWMHPGVSDSLQVWDKHSFTLKQTLLGHTGSVLALEYAGDKEWLFSSSGTASLFFVCLTRVYFHPGDSTIRVSTHNHVVLTLKSAKACRDIQIWSTITLDPLYVLVPYLETGAGDLFSLAWSSILQTIFIGCQNTSLQWHTFHDPISHAGSSVSICDISSSTSSASTPAGARKAHKFFDSYPQYERKPADIFANNGVVRRGSPDSDRYSDALASQAQVFIEVSNVIDSAHYGYVYCMTILGSGESVQLATGSGDESVKVAFPSSLRGECSVECSCGIVPRQGLCLCMNSLAIRVRFWHSLQKATQSTQAVKMGMSRFLILKLRRLSGRSSFRRSDPVNNSFCWLLT